MRLLKAASLSDFASALGFILFGAWILFPSLSVPNAPATSWLFSLMPRESWSLTLALVGIVQMLVVLSSSIRARRAIAILTACAWGALTGGVITMQGTLAALSATLAICMLLLFLYLNVLVRSERQ